MWTGVIEEECEKIEEAEAARKAAEKTRAPKSAPPSKSERTPREGSKNSHPDRPDKSWGSPKGEEEGEKPSPRGLAEVEEVEEGKTSSGSKPIKQRERIKEEK